jgi:hypothetical protein
MYQFKNATGKKIGGPVATREGALSMALHMANRRDEPITIVGPNVSANGSGDSLVVYPSAED